MKIFLAFLQGEPNHPVPAYSFWQYYIKNGIAEAGHTWIEDTSIDWAKGLVTQNKLDLASWKTNTWEKTVTYLKKHPVNLFLSYLYPHQIDQSAIAELKKMGIPCVNFFCDNVREFTKPPTEFGVFNLNWVPEYKALALYKKADFAYTHLPMPMWVEPKFRILPNIENEQISFIGSKDIQRQLFLEDLINKAPGIKLAIYGNGWLVDNAMASNKQRLPISASINNQIKFLIKYGLKAYKNKLKQVSYRPQITTQLKGIFKESLNFEQYINISRESLITLGINRYPSFNYPLNQPNTYSRLRDIEAPMLGACYLTEWTAGLDELYEIGTEIETYTTTAELIEKINMLKLDTKKRHKMRLNGQQKALEQHSISNTINKILCLINS